MTRPSLDSFTLAYLTQRTAQLTGQTQHDRDEAFYAGHRTLDRALAAGFNLDADRLDTTADRWAQTIMHMRDRAADAAAGR